MGKTRFKSANDMFIDELQQSINVKNNGILVGDFSGWYDEEFELKAEQKRLEEEEDEDWAEHFTTQHGG